MAYNTGNPIGSLDPRDAADNKENFDQFAVSTARTYTDRLGVERKTVTGTLQDYAAYNPRGTWTTATAYNVNDVWRDGAAGAFYLVLADYTSGASAAADIDGGNVVVHQPKDWVVSVDTIADLRNLEPAFDGHQVSMSGYNAAVAPDLPRGGGVFTAKYGDYSAEVSADTLTGIYVAFPSDPTGASGAWVRANADQSVFVSWFGAFPGEPDSTAKIQAALDYIGDRFSGDVSVQAGYIGWSYPALVFDDGTYICGTVVSPSKIKLRSAGQTVIKSLIGTQLSPAGVFINNAVTELDCSGLSFLYWDDVFVTPTNNADFSFHTIRDCNIAYCNSLLDQVSYSESRSTKTCFDNLRVTYGVPRVASIYSDVSEIKNSWIMHTTDTYLFWINSFCKFENNVIVPVGNDKTNRAVIYFESQDQARSLLIDGVRFGGESGQSAIVVVGDVNQFNANDNYRNQGVTIRRSDLSSSGVYDPDGIGGINANVIIRTPTSKNQSIQFVTIEDCYAGPDKAGGVIQYYGTVDAKDRLNDDLVIDVDRASTLSFTRGSNKITSDDLRPYLSTPLMKKKYFGPGRGTGKVVDISATANAGEYKFTVDVNISYPGDYLTPIAFEVILIGQSRSTNASFAYTYTSKYLVALSGIFTSALFARWSYVPQLESVGGISGDTNANINSVHWGAGDTGSADLALSGLSNPNQQVTITFGTNMARPVAYVRPLYDFNLRS